MQRRELLGLACALAAPWARAATQWRPYPGQPPIYLEGEVTLLTWSEPSPHLQLVRRQGATIPPGLSALEIAPHRDRARTRALLERTVLATSNDRTWRVLLPPLPKLLAWGVERPHIGQLVGVVGFAGSRIGGIQALQAELLFTGARGYPLRSEPL